MKLKLTPAKTGILIALLFFIWKMGLFLFNQQHHVLENFPIAPMMVLLFGGIIWTILRFRQEEPERFDLFSAFKQGARVGLINAVVTTGLMFLYYKFIDTDYLEIIQIDRAVKAQAGLQGEELENALKAFEFMFSLNSWIMFTLSGLTILGFIYALIVSILAKFILPPPVKS